MIDQYRYIEEKIDRLMQIQRERKIDKYINVERKKDRQMGNIQREREKGIQIERQIRIDILRQKDRQII